MQLILPWWNWIGFFKVVLVFLGLECFVFLGWIVKTGFGLLRFGCCFWFYLGLDNGFGFT